MRNLRIRETGRWYYILLICWSFKTTSSLLLVSQNIPQTVLVSNLSPSQHQGSPHNQQFAKCSVLVWPRLGWQITTTVMFVLTSSLSVRLLSVLSVWSGLWIINSTTETKAGHNPNIMTDSAISRWGFFCSSPGTFGCPAGELETSGGAGTSLRTLHITQYTLHTTHLHTPVRPSPSYSWWHSEFTESQIVTWFRLINCCLKFTPFSEETETMTIFQKSINIPF